MIGPAVREHKIRDGGVREAEVLPSRYSRVIGVQRCREPL